MKEVVVIGSGITGCCIAYGLAKRGFSVRCIDRHGVGHLATANNPGGLNPLHGPEIPGKLSDLALRSFELHRVLQGELAGSSSVDFEARRVGRLELAYGEHEVLALESAATLYKQTPGFSAEWISPGDLCRRESRIAGEVRAALLTQGNGMVNGHHYAQAMAEAVECLGAQRFRADVLGVETSGARVVRVLTGAGSFDCDHVVFATGAWFEEVSRWLGCLIPVRPLKGQLLLVEMPGGPFCFHVLRGMTGLYATPAGKAWLGGTQEDVGYDASPTPEGMQAILSSVSEFIPDVERAKILRHVAAFRPMTPDKLPVAGRIGGWENVHVASGGGVKGMLLATGMAELVLAGICEEEPPAYGEWFSPNRFREGI